MQVKEKTAALIVARLSSERIPRKNILPLDGIPMILRLIHRLKRSKNLDNIIVCTSNDASDDELCQLCESRNISFGRGPLDDVMERICSVARQHNVTNIVEVLGDNPFIQSDLVDYGIDIFNSEDVDYVANYSNDYLQELELKKFPIGVRVQIYSIQSALMYKDQSLVSRSHPSSFLYSNPARFKTIFFGAEGEWKDINYPQYNISVNYERNFEFADLIFKKFGGNVKISEIINDLESNAKLMDMIRQK